MAILRGKSAKDMLIVRTVMARGAIVWLKFDEIRDGVAKYGKIAIAGPREVPDVNITSKQDMQFTRELNARGSYVLD